ncbi:ATP-grasp fold amidoligase family protein [Alkalimonas delamerensis]|uniref:acylphosphatase n=1 Tax=Alkalimonas delamerensis TaxID=265981 RepID=A0ABT9GPS4_9GAMM|nr:ATP-grasp fold amidoligase family protein [Alkalimonas delamerensis]MDP4528978.1 ATP-grasp fold amidoligase family protein [Alkalimonas delamerensis]
MTEHALLFVITGQVQNVGFRKFVVKTAIGLDIAGWVQNCEDGSVRVLAAGPRWAQHAIYQALLSGPAPASVANVVLYPIQRKVKGFKLHYQKKPASFAHFFPNQTLPEPIAPNSYFVDSHLEKQAGTDKDIIYKSDLSEFKALAQQQKQEREKSHQLVQDNMQQMLRSYPKRSAEILTTYGAFTDGYHINHRLVKHASRHGSLASIPSFRLLMGLRTRKQLLADKGACPEWRLNDKSKSYHFIDSLGLQRPKSFPGSYKLAQLPEEYNIAIKPTAGAASKGVFLVYRPDYIVEVKTAQVFASYSAMKKRMQMLLKSGDVKGDAWLLEELVLLDDNQQQPARDLKFLCFYGEIALIREMSRFPVVSDLWVDSSGKQLDTGKDTGVPLADPTPIKREFLELVQKLSLEIPAPFMRIDFLLSKNQLVFGEFTPRPGSFALFNEETDRMLGDYFLKAEARLQRDLLLGKRFEKYSHYINKSFDGI